LDEDATNLYLNYVGILRWAVEISRIDLAHAVTTMAKFMASPREGHLIGILKIFVYLKLHMNSKILIDPFEQYWDSIYWIEANWIEFYPDVKKQFQMISLNLEVNLCKLTCLLIQLM